MARNKRKLKSIQIQSESEKDQCSLKVLNVLKSESALSVNDISGKSGVADDAIAEYINTCVKQDLLKISGSGKGELVKFNDSHAKILGVGFRGEECILSSLGFDGKISARESISINSVLKGKNKEIKEIVERIDKNTKLKGEDFCCAGIAVPAGIQEKNAKGSDILGEGIGRLFDCDVFVSAEATAAAYGERDCGKNTRGKDILYMHSDIGAGVVIKDEMIFEAGDGDEGKDDAYLRPWHQFGVAVTAKDLVSRGVGTDIVNRVSGDVDKITLEVVLEAAEDKDELAEDLVKRAGLAMGVRVAYLVNMFNTNMVIVGGGADKREGRFKDFVLESAERFLLKNMSGKLDVIPGVLGKEASSIGAAALSLRELFMEV